MVARRWTSSSGYMTKLILTPDGASIRMIIALMGTGQIRFCGASLDKH